MNYTSDIFINSNVIEDTMNVELHVNGCRVVDCTISDEKVVDFTPHEGFISIPFDDFEEIIAKYIRTVRETKNVIV